MSSLIVDWELTATTIYCDKVRDNVTLIIYKDSSSRCTGYSKYGSASIVPSGMKKKKLRGIDCEYPNCPRLCQYKDKIFFEEQR